MSVIIFRRLAASAALPTLLAGAILVANANPAHTHTTQAGSASSATASTHLAQHSIEVAASTKDTWHSLTWDVDSGVPAYQTLISELRDRGIQAGGSSENVASSSSRTVRVDTLSNTASNQYVALRVVAGSTHVTLAIRLSDLYVVGFWYSSAANARVFHYYPIAPSGTAPAFPASGVVETWSSVTTESTMLGMENYNDLARRGNVALNAVGISASSLEQSVRDLATGGANRAMTQSTARALLRLIIAVSEGTRFRPLANQVASAINNGGTFTTGDRYVVLIRDWDGISTVYRDHLDNPHSTTGHTVQGWGSVNSVATAAALLLAAMGAGSMTFPKTEL
ncbi:ribosome-inactivating family protein [Streptomyces maremycinicus]|uniref:ribosome-inactivating family protein n=1 Tax=Streptomyces maremycinicus TaxID=1679753 RepID=UPI0007890BC3|nr:ribosome-inactivating family protein [Streptomyces sp. NBRC 110468]